MNFHYFTIQTFAVQSIQTQWADLQVLVVQAVQKIHH